MGLLIASCPLSLQVSFSPSIFSTFPLTSMYLLTNGAPLPKSIQATPFPSPQSSRPWLADYAACIVLCLHSRYALHRRCLHRHGPLLRMKVHEIVLTVAAAAKSTEMKKIGTQSPLHSPIRTRPSSPHGTTNNVASPPTLLCCKEEFIYRLQGVRGAKPNGVKMIDERSN